MVYISDILARQILDSRGNPTLEVDVKLSDGSLGRAAVPSGASTGEYEAYELRDDNSKFFNGMSVLKAIENVNVEIFNTFSGRNPFQQRNIDRDLIELDGTANKNKLGANAILGFSMAVARAAANSLNLPLWKYIGGMRAYTLPVPMMNIINGGAHANNGLDFQECMIMPIGFSKFSDALRSGTEIFLNLKKILTQKGFSTSVGDEGGFAPNLKSNIEAIELIIRAIEKTSYKPYKDVFIALDVAASEIFHNNKYHLQSDKRKLTSDEMIEYYETLINNYPIISIEDGLDENDWNGWKELNRSIGTKCQIVADDLTVTNKLFLEKALKNDAINSILIKLNQIGTVTETIETINLAKENDISTMISHRSGETEDTTISDLAVGLNAGQIKAGSLCRTDRVSKYNQLLRIEDYLNDRALYEPLSLSKYF